MSWMYGSGSSLMGGGMGGWFGEGGIQAVSQLQYTLTHSLIVSNSVSGRPRPKQSTWKKIVVVMMKKIYKYSSLFRKLIERLSSDSLDVMDINLNWFPFRELIQLTSMAHLTSLSESSWHGSWLLAVMLRLTAMCLTTEVATVVPTGVGNLCRTLWFALSHWISSWSDAHSEYMVKLPTLHLNYR